MPAQPATQTASSEPIVEVPLGHAMLRQLYATMLKSRMFASQHRNSTTAEALIAGTLANLEKEDVVVTSAPASTLENLGATANGNEPQKMTIVPAAEEVAVGIAAGVAAGLKLSGSSAVAVAIVPGKSTSGKSAQHVLEFTKQYAGVPMVLIADWTSSRTSARNHDGQALSCWPVPTIAVDGRDVIAVYRVTKEAISAARRGHGPTLVDCVNFLAPGTRGRDQRDPLVSFQRYLERHNAWSEEWYRELNALLQSETAKPNNKRKSARG
jgi:Dehydrogenase E1 component